MIGAVIGDVAGSSYEYKCPKTKDIELLSPGSRYTDDTVMTIATAYAIMNKKDYAESFRHFGRQHPSAGYGAMFNYWLFSDNEPAYNSFGNGSAMRVSPVGYAAQSEEEAFKEAALNAGVSHNHEEGLKGAQAVALCVYMARHGASKDEIRRRISSAFQYDLSRTCDGIRVNYSFDETCQKTVPEAITAFLDSTDFEDAIRNAISLGGDADTLACITGSVAEAYYKKIPRDLARKSLCLLPKDFLFIIKDFYQRYQIKNTYE